MILQEHKRGWLNKFTFVKLVSVINLLLNVPILKFFTVLLTITLC